MYFRKYSFSIVALLSVASIFAMKETKKNTTVVEIITGSVKTLQELALDKNAETFFALGLKGCNIISFCTGDNVNLKSAKSLNKSLKNLPANLSAKIPGWYEKKADAFYNFILGNIKRLVGNNCLLTKNMSILKQVSYIPLLHNIITQAKKNPGESIQVLVPNRFDKEFVDSYTRILPQFTEVLQGCGLVVKVMGTKDKLPKTDSCQNLSLLRGVGKDMPKPV